jgi:hypothetical protein
MNFKEFFCGICMYILILVKFGYLFGVSDQCEMLPYAKFLNNKHLYPVDFYIQSISSHEPNERYVFSKLLSYFADELPNTLIFLHFLTTLILIFGLLRFSKLYITSKNLQWLACLIVLYTAYKLPIGANVLYSNIFIPAMLAQALGIWAFALGIEKQILKSYLLLAFITFIHPQIGFQIWLILTLYILMVEKSWKNMMGFSVIYWLIIGYFIISIRTGYEDKSILNEDYLSIVEFRASHHYFPNYFSSHDFVKTFLLLFAFLFASKSSLRYIIYIVIVGAMTYTVGLFIFKSPFVLGLQWFRTFIWAKTFAIIGLVGVFEYYTKNKPLYIFLNKEAIIQKFICATAILGICYITIKRNDIPNLFKQEYTLEKDISIKAKEKTKVDALFLVPFNFEVFRYWSERNTFVDFKTINHRQGYYKEWYNRIKEIYGIDITNKRAGDNIYELAKNNFDKLKENEFRLMNQKYKITHVLTSKEHKLSFPITSSNEDYTIYQIE